MQKNVHCQGQRNDAHKVQDEFLDTDLNHNKRNVDKMDISEKKENDEEDALIKKWKKIRSYFLVKYSNLDELDVTHGENRDDFEQMLGRLEKKTETSKEQLRKEIKDWNEKDLFFGN